MKVKEKRYLVKEHTPMKWYWFSTRIRIPLSMLLLLGTLAGLTNSEMPIVMFEVIIQITLFVVTLVAEIGLILYARLGLILYFLTYVINFIYYTDTLMLYIKNGLDETIIVSNLIVLVVWLVLEGIYYWKRRLLFVSNPFSEEDADYQEVFHKEEIQKNEYETEECSATTTNDIPEKAKLDEKISIDRINELKQFKELLDIGAITQEEYEEKKKTILYKKEERTTNSKIKNASLIKNKRSKIIIILLATISLLLIITLTISLIGTSNKNQQINVQIETLEEEINTLEKRNTELKDEISSLESELEVCYYEIHFIDECVVFVEDDGSNLYHKYQCSKFLGNAFWAYNVEAAIGYGYTACPLCH